MKLRGSIERIKVLVKVGIRRTVIRPVCPGITLPSAARDKFLFHFHGNYLLAVVGLLLWGVRPDERTSL